MIIFFSPTSARKWIKKSNKYNVIDLNNVINESNEFAITHVLRGVAVELGTDCNIGSKGECCHRVISNY